MIIWKVVKINETPSLWMTGTSDRVCIIVGRVEDVKEAHFAIWEKIKKKQEIAGDEAKLNVSTPYI